mmetsp:Transcript_145049/g.205281  ORF Transcript_145049/g.205281 Transcript_145049/m.205281 type:complete len:693 (-) Transcript_145049:25-2103(-)
MSSSEELSMEQQQALEMLRRMNSTSPSVKDDDSTFSDTHSLGSPMAPALSSVSTNTTNTPAKLSIETSYGLAFILDQSDLFAWTAGRAKCHALADHIDYLARGNGPDDFVIVYKPNTRNMSVLQDHVALASFPFPWRRNVDQKLIVMHNQDVNMPTSPTSSSSESSDENEPINNIQFYFGGDFLLFPLYRDDINVIIGNVIDARVCDEAYNRGLEISPYQQHYVLSVAGMEMDSERWMSDYVHSIDHDDDYTLAYYPRFQVKIHFDHDHYHDVGNCKPGDVFHLDGMRGTSDVWDVKHTLTDAIDLECADFDLYYKDRLLDNAHENLRSVFVDFDLTHPSHNDDYTLRFSCIQSEPINYIHYEGEAYPFETYKFPLYRSDMKHSVDELTGNAVSFFENEGALNDNLTHKYVLKTENSQNGEWDEDTVINLVCIPVIEISAKIEFLGGIRETYKMFANTHIWLLKYEIIFGRDGLRRSDLRVLYKGEDVDEYKEFREIFEDINSAYVFHEVEVKLRGSGGGKRGRTSVSMSPKDDITKSLEDEIGTSILRIQAQPNASPAISQAITALVHLVALAKNEKSSGTEILNNLNMKELKQLLSVSSSASKADAKCKGMAEVVFANAVASLQELERQTALTNKALKLGINYYLMKKFSDDNGNILWTTALNDEVAKCMEEVAKKTNGQNAHSSNGVGN